MKHLTSIALASLAFGMSLAAQGGLPPVPVPPENPITKAKVDLGHILFWDEQLSTDNTMACGTCHQHKSGGADPIVAHSPGPDRILNTADDTHSSFGVVHCNSSREFDPDPVFGLDRQMTPRTTPSSITSQYARLQFWDGRGSDTFVDPQTGATRIARGGSLESQAVGPILGAGEMSHEGRTWTQVIAKLNRVTPMALGTNLPARMTATLSGSPDYGELFRRAFGDRAVTATRIGFAIASYERTLVANQTPFDRGTMTHNQQMGFNAFRMHQCDRCHQPPFFTDHSFRTLGLRPASEDSGREAITKNPADRGAFKVPSLRGVGQRKIFMHNGAFSDLNQVFDFYNRQLPFFPANRDPILATLTLPSMPRSRIKDFLENALTDPRAVAGTFPFDRPTLRSERLKNRVYGMASGAANQTPVFVSSDPAYVGSQELRFGIDQAHPGALAFLALSDRALTTPVVIGGIAINVALGTTSIASMQLQTGLGHGTMRVPVPNDPNLRGISVFAQWFVADPNAPSGIAATRGVEYPIE